MNTDELQWEFLKSEFSWLSLQAALQRSKVYGKGTPEKRKAELRSVLRDRIEEISKGYINSVKESDHERNIILLANKLTERFREILKNHHFGIGVTQKAVNLYLKYLWCKGKIAMPPQCPFDRNIIELLPKEFHLNWTEIENIEEYRKLVAAAKKEAGSEPLAVWELRNFQEIMKKVRTRESTFP